MNKRMLSQLGLVVTTFLWGVTFVMVKDALNDAPPFAFSAWRFLMAAVVGFVISRRTIFHVTRTELLGGLICGFFLFSGYGFQNFGLMLTTASKSAFITSVSIILVPVILVVAGVQKIRFRIWGSIFLAIAGLYLILNPHGGEFNTGDVLTLGCALSFALHIIFQDRYANRGIRVIPFFVVQAFTVAFLSFGNHLVFESDPVIWSTRLITALLVTALGGTLFGFGMMIYAQRYLSPSRTAIIFSLEPVFAALFAFFFTAERLTTLGWVGGLLVVMGVILAETGKE